MKKIKELVKLFSIALMTGMILVSCNSGTKSDDSAKKGDAEEVKTEVAAPNTLTAEEVEQGFVLLFDGKSGDGWRGYGKETFPTGWIIDEGALKCNGSGRGEAGAADGGDIIYDKKFSNFTLRMEWKISEGGNSGIFYLGQEDPKWATIWRTAPEMQLLDND